MGRWPVLADFGIAAWGASNSPPAGATRPVERLGPANFIAPEMRYNRPADRGKHADVYSLAKTLFVLALPHRGPYPPDGTHRTDSKEFWMLEAAMDRSSVRELGHILEAATEFDRYRRLPMADLRDELCAWLDRYPDEQLFRPLRDVANPRGMSVFWTAVDRSHYLRDREETKNMMTDRIQLLASALTGRGEDAWDDWEEEESKGSGEVLGDYVWEPNDGDDFVPEGWVWMATLPTEGRRIVLWAVLDGNVSFIAESQTGGPPWTLEKQWDRTEWARPRMPRAAEKLKKLTDEVTAWIVAEAEAAQRKRS